MYRLILLVVAAIVFHNLSFSQDWTEDTCELNGNVAALEYSRTSNMNGPKEIWYAEKLEYKYNAQGYVTWYNLSGTYFGENANSTSRIFDASGTRCLIEYEMQEGDTTSRYEYFYDDNGNVDTAILYRWDKYLRTFCYLHNSKGQLTEYYVEIPESGYTSRHYYNHDAAGRKISSSEWSPTVKKNWKWTYNENGYLVEEQLIDSNWASTTTVKMDKNGKPVKSKTVDHSQKARTSDGYTLKYTVNSTGQVTEELKLDSEGNPVTKRTYTYNDRGDIASQVYYSYEKDAASEFAYTYVYDDKGNWITKTILRSGVVYEEEKRVITYY